MEGYLKKWTNIFQRWQSRFFVLNDHVLLYCDQQGGQIKGQIHLRVASISLMPEDPLRIIIFTGTTEIHLRASTIAEKINWVNALRNSQEQCLTQKNYRNELQGKGKQIYETLTDIWVTQAAFDETMSSLIPKLEKNSNVKELAIKLEQLGKTLKNKITLCTNMLEEEQQRVHSNSNGGGRYDFEEDDNGNTIFQSFIDQQSQQSKLVQEIPQQMSNQPNYEEFTIEQILEPIKQAQPIKYKNIIDNQVFKKIKWNNQQYRNKLLSLHDPNEKLNIFSLLKDLVGKDLTRFAVPVYLNEPLSMLQRLAEQIEYYTCIEKANSIEDPQLRMCYIMAMGVSVYASNINRAKKPFNPILGETYELNYKSFRFISEQVSHHPPISAGYAESKDFEFWAHTAIKSKFWGRSMEVQPQGSLHVVLKNSKDHYTFNKCTTRVQNILFGQINLVHIGEMKFKNHRNNDYGSLILPEQSWNSKESCEVQGYVKNEMGIEKYRIQGSWDKELFAINVETKEKIQIWQRSKLPDKAEWYYYFTDFAMNLNHLTADMIQNLPCTDCRLRPDQLALEMGLREIAVEEKFRLEEKQRIRRREMQAKSETHKPKFFVEQLDPLTQETCYVFKRNYWNKNNDEGLDLF